MRLTQECVFDLPELAEYVADNLPQQSLGHCVRVSKSWHAIFIQYLWWTFADKPETNWDRLLKRAIRKQVPTSDGQDIEWFKDVYRRHAQFIRHLEIHHPVILGACLPQSVFDEGLAVQGGRMSSRDSTSPRTTTVTATTAAATQDLVPITTVL